MAGQLSASYHGYRLCLHQPAPHRLTGRTPATAGCWVAHITYAVAIGIKLLGVGYSRAVIK